jgi:hypothetical protein
MAGFEPAASCSQSRRANQAAPHPVGIRSLSCRTVVRRRPAIRTPGRARRSRHNLLKSRSEIAVWPPRHDHREPGTLLLAVEPPRGRSSMVELQPSKLVMRVRFPSPAPTENPQARGLIPDRFMITPTVFGQARATTGYSRAALRVFARLVRGGQPDLLHQAAECLRDCLVAVPGCVLIDQCGSCGRVTEAGHQLLEAHSRR